MVGVHSDIDLTRIVSDTDGWVLKMQGGVAKPFYRKTMRESAKGIISTTVPTTYTLYILSLPRAGTYSFQAEYSFSSDTTSGDIVTKLEINATALSEHFSITMRNNVADANGNDGDGRGTNQKLPASHRHYFNAPSAGDYEFKFTYRSSNGATVSIWDWSCIVEEEVGILTKTR